MPRLKSTKHYSHKEVNLLRQKLNSLSATQFGMPHTKSQVSALADYTEHLARMELTWRSNYPHRTPPKLTLPPEELMPLISGWKGMPFHRDTEPLKSATVSIFLNKKILTTKKYNFMSHSKRWKE